MPDYNVGSASVDIIPNFKGFVESVARQSSQAGSVGGRAFGQSFAEEARRALSGLNLGPGTAASGRQGEQSGGAFADGFRARVSAALRDLPDAKVGADTSGADAQIDELRARLTALRDARIGIDISDTEALAQLDMIRARLDELGARSPSVQVQTDTARASAELAAFQAEVNHIDGQTATVNVAVNDTSGGMLGGLLGAGGFGSPLLTLAPAAVPLGAVGAVGAAGALTGAAGLAAGAGAGILGLMGVVKAYQDQTKASQQAGASAASTANQQISAAASVRSAEESLANTRRTAAQAAISAAEQVKNAEQSLADTERSVAEQQRQASEQVTVAKEAERNAAVNLTQAQQAENQARQQAVLDLQTYANNAIDTRLSAAQARLDLEQAIATQGQINASSTSTDLQREQAALDVAKARQALVEATQSATQAAKDNQKAQAAGISGDKGVVAAVRQVTQARQAEADATRRVSDAERNQRITAVTGAEQIRKAQQAVTDAQRAQASQAAQSAYSVQQAQQSLANAQRSLATAAQTTSAASTTAAADLAKLTPAGREFVRFIQGTLAPAFAKLKATAQENLLPGLTAGLREMRPLLPILTRDLGDVAREMGGLFRQIGKELTDPFWTRFLTFLGPELSKALGIAVRSIGNIAEGLARMFKRAAPIINEMGRGFEGLTKDFAAFGRSPEFRDFLHYVVQSMPTVWQFLQTLGGVILELLKAAAPIGTVLLKALTLVGKAIENIPTPVLTAMIGALMGAPFGPIGIAIGAIGTALIYAYNHSKPFRDFINNDLVPALKTYLLPVLQDLWSFIKNTLVPVLGGILSHVLAGVKSAFDDVMTAVKNNKGPLTDLWNIFKTVVGWVVRNVLPLFGTMLEMSLKIAGNAVSIFIDALGWLVRAFEKIPSTAKRIWGDIKQWFRDGVNDVVKVIDFFLGIVDKVLGWVGINVSWHIDEPFPNTAANTGGNSGGGKGSGNTPLAAGGTIGGGFVTNRPTAIVGEGGPHPEFVIPTDPKHRDRALALYQSLGAQLMAGGGILGWVEEQLLNPAGHIIDAARSVLGHVAGPVLSALESPLHAAINALPDGFMKDAAGGLIHKLNTAVVNMINGSPAATAPAPTPAGGGRGAPAPGGGGRVYVGGSFAGLDQGVDWTGNFSIHAPDDIRITTVNTASGWPGGTLIAGQFTSGAAKDRYAYFAEAITPAVHFGGMVPRGGLIGTVNSPYPGSETGFAMDSAGTAYGNMYEGKGGNPPDPQAVAWAHYIGLAGYDQGGVLPPGLQTVLNATGKPEAVLNSAQWDALMHSATPGDLGPKLDRVAELLETLPHSVDETVRGAAKQHASDLRTNQLLLDRRPR